MEKKKNGARIAINSGYSTQLVPRCLSGELPPQTWKRGQGCAYVACQIRKKQQKKTRNFIIECRKRKRR